MMSILIEAGISKRKAARNWIEKKFNKKIFRISLFSRTGNLSEQKKSLFKFLIFRSPDIPSNDISFTGISWHQNNFSTDTLLYLINLTFLDRGGGQVVSLIAFNYDNLGSNPAEAYTIL